MALKRISKEIEDLKKDPFYNIKYGIDLLNNNDLFHYSGWFLGLENTPYEKGRYYFNVRFPTDYPFKPMKINLITRIYHISINANGTLCCCNWPELSYGDGWSPSFTFLKIIKLIRERLNNYPETCIRASLEQSNLYHTNKDEYFKIAREWTKKYAIDESENNENIWDVYEKGNLIGSGKFGDVYYGVEKSNKNTVAIKIVKIGNDEEIRKLVQNEIETMKKIKSNVLIETKMDELNVYFVMNLYGNNLENILNKRKSGFSYNEIKNIFKELNPTFKELHENKIMHGDLKLNNILIKYKDQKKIDFNVSLADFGLSKTISSSKH